MIARSMVEGCDAVKVKKLMLFGGPNAGVSMIHDCQDNILCTLADWAAKFFVYWDLIQDIVAPADYFRDPAQLKTFLKDSIFLPYLNNMKQQKNETYKENFEHLDALRLFKWLNDTVVYPKESEWFATIDEYGFITNMEDQDFYK